MTDETRETTCLHCDLVERIQKALVEDGTDPQDVIEMACMALATLLAHIDGPAQRNAALTFAISQLVRRTADYVARLEADDAFETVNAPTSEGVH